MPRLIANVFAEGAWYGPDYPQAGDPPAGSVVNPSAWEDGEVPPAPRAATKQEEPPTDPNKPAPAPSGDGGQVPPPMSGPGSSADHWREYAKSLGVSVGDDAKRGDIVKEIADAGFRVE